MSKSKKYMRVRAKHGKNSIYKVINIHAYESERFTLVSDIPLQLP